MLCFAAMHLYRLNKPIAEQNVPVVLERPNGDAMLVDGPIARFFSDLHDCPQAAGLSAGLPELAGFGPGFHLALGTKPPVDCGRLSEFANFPRQDLVTYTGSSPRASLACCTDRQEPPGRSDAVGL
jgi:hypothetical protein